MLYQPEIPPNTGNIIRLCANINARLHLIHPLGFSLDASRLKRAGLDYYHLALIHEYTNFATFLEQNLPARIWAFSTKGDKLFTSAHYEANDYLLFGPETRGLPNEILTDSNIEEVLRLPMVAKPGNRSLNLNNTVAIAAYEAWRQHDFAEREVF